MDNRTKGAWIIRNMTQLQRVSNFGDFEKTNTIGKCGVYLSSLAASDAESILSDTQCKSIAKLCNITELELFGIHSKLKDAQLID